jgi:hypothetical protein
MKRRLATFIMFTTLAAAHATSAAPTGEINHAAKYDACMDLASRDSDKAFNKALAWRDLGVGGDAARHGVAKVLMGLGQYGEAAHRFKALAQGIKDLDRAIAGVPLRAEVLVFRASARRRLG